MEIQEGRLLDKSRILQEWLHPPDSSEHYNRAIEARHKGTGSWLLHTSQFTAWKLASLPHLWIHGVMGCGKTVLAAMVIENIQEGSGCLYFFFDHTDKTKQDFLSLLRSLVYQLYMNHKATRSTMHESLSLHENGNRQPSTRSLQSLFGTMVRQLGEVCIVLDALDECEERKKVYSWIEELHQLGLAVRFIITSRREADIEKALTQWISLDAIIEIRERDVSEDIRSYVGDQIRTDFAFSRWRADPDVQEEIITELTQKADGM